MGMPDLVLVTGVSGFVGGHVALRLLNEGFAVRGSLRDLKRADKVQAVLSRHGADTAKLEFVALDLLRDDGWRDAMKGVRYLQHVASPFVISMPKDPQDLIRPAVSGTERALEAAFEFDVERVVLTSSMAAIMYGHGPQAQPFTGADWTNAEAPRVTAYIQSKTLAERRAWEVAAAAGRRDDLVAINPSAIYGPLLDEDPGTSALVLMRMMRGDMPGVPRISLPGVDVRDVAEAHVKAVTDPDAGGKRIPMSEGSITMPEMSRALAEAFPQFGKKLPKRQLPDWFVRLYALADKDVRDNLVELGPERRIDSSSAKRLLGHDLVPVREAVVEMGRSLVSQRLV